MCACTVVSALVRRLSMIATVPPMRLAWPSARLMLPSSGLTMTAFDRSMPECQKVLVEHGRGVKVIDRHVEKALDLRRRAGPS